MISTLIGLLSALSFGMASKAQSVDLRVQFDKQKLQDEPAISSLNEEKDSLQLKDATSLTDEPAIEDKLLEASSPTPQQQAPIEPCPACGMG
ncbi:MAG TPA: hypothetical protein V6D15_02025 [Oculatellaceae cyanobacterium]